jgi:drug/metabolite transporter (DMT)-like permease
MYLMPPVAAVIAWFVIDERFTAIKIIGAVVTMAGVALAQFGSDLSMVWKRRNQSVGIR